MSLTKPFINTISAFDATKNNSLPYLSVLGGDIITAYTYRVYNANTNALIYTNTIGVQNDILSSDIRTYSMQIPANTCVNNGEYYVTASTSNDITVETSALVQSTPFTCYVTPCVSFQYDSGDGVYVSLTNGVTFSTPNVTIRLYFDTIDLNSPAILNSTKVNLYGIKSSGIVDSVYSGNILYNKPFQQTIGGLTNTTGENAKYIYYKLTIEGITVDGMVFSQINIGGSGTPNYVNSITNLGCTYVEYGAGGNFFATNDCVNGRVEVSYNVPTVKNNPFVSIYTILALAQDETNVYAGGGSGKFAIYNKASDSFGGFIPNPIGADFISGIEQDTADVYVVGYSGKFTIYNKSSGVFGGLVANPFDTSNISSVLGDSDNVYCGGESGKFAVYNKSSGVFGGLISTPFGASAIMSLAQDETNVYCGGQGGKFAIYNKSSGVFGSLVANPFDTNTILSLAQDETSVYCGGGSGKFAIYNKASGTFGSLITHPFGTSNLRGLTVDNDNVYCGGQGGKFAIYNKSSGVFGSLIPTPFGGSIIYTMVADNANVYCGGSNLLAVYTKVGSSFGGLITTSFLTNSFTTIYVSGNDIYCGGTFGSFAVYNKINKNFSSLVVSPFSDSTITSITGDETSIYCGGGENGKFAKYDLISKTFGSLISTPFGASAIMSLAQDETNVYCGGQGGKFAIYNKSSGTFGSLITTPFGTDNFRYIVTDDINVYCTVADDFTNNGKFAIYNKASGTFGSLISSPFGVNAILALAQDETNVYAGGSSGKFAIYNKASGTFGSLISTPFGTGSFRSISVDDDNVYCGGSSGKFAIYNKSSGVFGSLVANPFGASEIMSLAQDETSVYCGGTAGVFAVYSKQSKRFVPAIEMLLQRKLLEEDNNWIDLQELLFTSFKVYDTYNQNGVAYEYRLIAKQNSNVGITCSVLSQFGKSYICDSQTLYDITNELAYSSTDFVQETTLYSPIGSEFPFMAKNAKTKYNKGSATALLFSPTTRSGYVDRMAQVKLVKEFNSWLTNGTCKVMKDINGNIGIYFIQNSVNNNYYKELGNGLAGVSFEYAEAGRFTQLQLQKLGMLNNFLVIYV